MLCNSYIHDMIFITSVFKIKQELYITLGLPPPPTKTSGCAPVAQFWKVGTETESLCLQGLLLGTQNLGFLHACC